MGTEPRCWICNRTEKEIKELSLLKTPERKKDIEESVKVLDYPINFGSYDTRIPVCSLCIALTTCHHPYP
ncbi:MAG: hypothetical protein KAT70_02330 [Thermoplasmata archaeon]|nr:hypothetical protein [Thermoplasmata archaeon]